MSTYPTRRVVRKRRDYAGLLMFLVVLAAVPAVGWVAYTMVNDPDALAEYGLKPIDGQPAPVPPAPVAPAVTPAVVSTPPVTPPKMTPKTGNEFNPSNEVAHVSTQIARAEPPKKAEPAKSTPPMKGPGKPQSVTAAVEHIGATINEALGIPRKVMVVWLVDESMSNSDYRRDLKDAISKTYGGLKLTSDAKTPDDQPLLSVVAAYGKDIRFLTPEPTAKTGEVTQAVGDIADSDSGEENTIKALDEAVTKFGSYRQKGRHLMFVVVSDEVGDDRAKIDTVLPKLKQIPVYVVGVVAPFGTDGMQSKLQAQGGTIIGTPDPSFAKGDQKVVYGPESHDIEWVKLQYPDGSGDQNLGDLDLGPYALSRLCSETGGEYFALRTRRYEQDWASSMPQVQVERPANSGPSNADSYFAAVAGAAGGGVREMPKLDEAKFVGATPSPSFSSSPTVAPNMKKYAPQYISEDDYKKSIAANKAKHALLAAAQMPAVTVLSSNVRADIDTTDETRKTRSVIAAQKPAALVQPNIDALYDVLKKGESDSAKLTEPRWKAGYDLAFGRVMAAKARADAFMFQLAAIRNGKSAHGLQPSDEKTKNSVVDKLADNARTRLEGIVKDYPGTPWAKAAERELRQPMSWKLME